MVRGVRLCCWMGPVERWQEAMRACDFERAWRIADEALQSSSGDHEWTWDGRPVEGKRVLVRCCHGLGDTIMFARFLPRLASVAHEVRVCAQPPLLPVLRRIAPDCRCLRAFSGTWYIELELMEVPHALRATVRETAGSVPYLHVPPTPRPSPLFNVGLVTRAGDWNPSRSIPLPELAPLTSLPGIAWYSLVPGAGISWARDLSSPDVLLVASHLRSLDLVLTVDTFTAHLAGAVGAPTWTLLPARADWRWLDRGPRTPWYPRMRLFRQPSPGDWASAIACVRRELRSLLEQAA